MSSKSKIALLVKVATGAGAKVIAGKVPHTNTHLSAAAILTRRVPWWSWGCLGKGEQAKQLQPRVKLPNGGCVAYYIYTLSLAAVSRDAPLPTLRLPASHA